MKTFAIIIAGSRDYNDYKQLQQISSILISSQVKSETENVDITIISGGARGADTLGERFALENNYKLVRKNADWNKWGKGAGYRRNCDMAIEARQYDKCLCLAFSINNSKGTNHMVNICEKYGVPCIKIEIISDSPTGIVITEHFQK